MESEWFSLHHRPAWFDEEGIQLIEHAAAAYGRFPLTSQQVKYIEWKGGGNPHPFLVKEKQVVAHALGVRE